MLERGKKLSLQQKIELILNGFGCGWSLSGWVWKKLCEKADGEVFMKFESEIEILSLFERKFFNF